MPEVRGKGDSLNFTSCCSPGYSEICSVLGEALPAIPSVLQHGTNKR